MNVVFDEAAKQKHTLEFNKRLKGAKNSLHFIHMQESIGTDVL